MNNIPATIDDLKEDPENPREISDKALAGLKRSLSAFGDLSGIVFNSRTGELVCGHQRVKALRASHGSMKIITEDENPPRIDIPGAEPIFIRVVDWPRLMQRQANIAANAPTIQGKFTDALYPQLQDFKLNGADLYGDLGLEDMMAEYNPGEQVSFVAHAGAPEDLDELPEAPPKRVKQGEMWSLGAHRLICGDCTDEALARRVLGGGADICLTDPPYGIGLEYDEFKDTEENVAALAKAWLPVARKMAPVVVFSPGITRQWLYPVPNWVMCWFYGGGQLRSSWGFNSWQPWLCYGKDPSLATGNGCRPDAVDMNTPANSKDLAHPCPKPVAIIVWMMQRLMFAEMKKIFEPFAGSGTTIVAAETLGHEVCAMELSPVYCDVIIARWEKLTGKKAALITE